MSKKKRSKKHNNNKNRKKQNQLNNSNLNAQGPKESEQPVAEIREKQDEMKILYKVDQKKVVKKINEEKVNKQLERNKDNNIDINKDDMKDNEKKSFFVKFLAFYSILFCILSTAEFLPWILDKSSFVWTIDGVNQHYPTLVYLGK